MSRSDERERPKIESTRRHRVRAIGDECRREGTEREWLARTTIPRRVYLRETHDRVLCARVDFLSCLRFESMKDTYSSDDRAKVSRTTDRLVQSRDDLWERNFRLADRIRRRREREENAIRESLSISTEATKREDRNVCSNRTAIERVIASTRAECRRYEQEHSVPTLTTTICESLVVSRGEDSYIRANACEHRRYDVWTVRSTCRFLRSYSWTQWDCLLKRSDTDRSPYSNVENDLERSVAVVFEPKNDRRDFRLEASAYIPTSLFVFEVKSRRIFISMKVVHCRSIVTVRIINNKLSPSIDRISNTQRSDSSIVYANQISTEKWPVSTHCSRHTNGWCE